MKRLFTLMTVCFFLNACGWHDWSTNRKIDKKRAQYQTHHSDDTKGRSHFPKHRADIKQKTFIFDPKATAWAAYDANGNRVKTGRASGGKGFCADVGRPCRTVTGRFKVYSKRGPDCVSNKYPVGEGGAPMPNCMFFHGGYSIHGSYNVPDHNASHGCVRVLPSAAKWLDNNFMQIGTRVVVERY